MSTKKLQCLEKERKQIELISKKLDVIVKLTALKATRGVSFEDRIRILQRFGFSIKDIGMIVNQPQREVRRELNK
jgi:hypothetical protein